jgi:hypothetical protein
MTAGGDKSGVVQLVIMHLFGPRVIKHGTSCLPRKSDVENYYIRRVSGIVSALFTVI